MTINVTLSPYWLRLYGKWIHLEGIAPEVEITSQRAFNELITVDGHRHVQRAPRGPRSWTLSYEYATAAATAALESAANDYNFSDPSMRTLFLDTNEAAINMVPPDLLTTWRNPNATSGPQVYNVGEPDGLPIWLPTYDGGPNPAGGISIQVPVRAGVTYKAVVWTTVGTGQVAVAVTGAATVSANGLNGSTVANPHQAIATFTPVADGVVTVQPALGFTAGLMVYEGDCAPTSYRAGRRMPCSISVQDPSLSTNVIWPNSCDPCDLPRQGSSFVLQEVGADTTTPVAVY